MKKLICFFSLSFIIFSSVNIFATQLPTDFLATLNTQQQNQEQEEEKERYDGFSEGLRTGGCHGLLQSGCRVRDARPFCVLWSCK